MYQRQNGLAGKCTKCCRVLFFWIVKVFFLNLNRPPEAWLNGLYIVTQMSGLVIITDT